MAFHACLGTSRADTKRQTHKYDSKLFGSHDVLSHAMVSREIRPPCDLSHTRYPVPASRFFRREQANAQGWVS